MQQLDKLKKYSCKVLYNQKSVSRFLSGGNISNLLVPKDLDSFILVLKSLDKDNIEYKIIGNCTNILIKDEGYKGVLISTTNIKGIVSLEDNIFAKCGDNIKDVYLKAKYESLSGFEQLAQIPGSIGGAIKMNAGAFNREIIELIEYIDIYQKGKTFKIYKDEIDYSYRRINLDKDMVILGAKFHLERKKQIKIVSVEKECEIQRQKNQPKGISLGSVFKNGEDYYAAKLIESVNLKGYEIGGAKISKKHANFIMNVDNASTKDFLDLVALIKKRVYEKYNIELELEVEVL